MRIKGIQKMVLFDPRSHAQNNVHKVRFIGSPQS